VRDFGCNISDAPASTPSHASSNLVITKNSYNLNFTDPESMIFTFFTVEESLELFVEERFGRRLVFFCEAV
jgi:hypothetical protein